MISVGWPNVSSPCSVSEYFDAFKQSFAYLPDYADHAVSKKHLLFCHFRQITLVVGNKRMKDESFSFYRICDAAFVEKHEHPQRLPFVILYQKGWGSFFFQNIFLLLENLNQPVGEKISHAPIQSKNSRKNISSSNLQKNKNSSAWVWITFL